MAGPSRQTRHETEASMLWALTRRALTETDKRLLWQFVRTMTFRVLPSVLKHKRRLQRGEFFPPFLFIAVTNCCNLRCQGCWMDVDARPQMLPLEALNRLVAEAREMGNAFFGIVGGEPLLHPQLLQFFEQNRDCYFQLFTNGHFLTDEVARELRRLGNVTPLVSIEGSEVVSDQRRGRRGVFSKSMQGLQNCLKYKLLTGVATSVCKTNLDDLVTEQWVDRLIELGVFYVWFYIYHPMGPRPCPELCLSREEQLRVRRFVVEMRVRKPIVFIDAYHDADGRALCPAVTGLSHHIGPWGDIEPCPVIQFATDSILDDDRPLRDKFLRSAFLHDFRETVRRTTRGCIVLERPDLLQQLVERHGARDTTARQTALQELREMERRTSQYVPGHEIPERSWVYRLVKRYLFSDFGLYAELDAGQNAQPTRPAEAPTRRAESNPSRHASDDDGGVSASDHADASAAQPVAR